MTDQQQIWNKRHDTGDHAKWSNQPRPFAIKVIEDIAPNVKLLELGCGVGSDARFFAQKGINVLATDFSPSVIRQNIERGLPDNLEFAVIDIAEPLPYDNESFDAIYAYLSLHYYDEAKTRDIFQEMARVLKPNGKLHFSCKSINDRKFGEGEQVEPGIFIAEGQIRHFFSLEYTRQLVKQNFKLVSLEETFARYNDKRSDFIECWAAKKK